MRFPGSNFPKFYEVSEDTRLTDKCADLMPVTQLDGTWILPTFLASGAIGQVSTPRIDNFALLFFRDLVSRSKVSTYLFTLVTLENFLESL